MLGANRSVEHESHFAEREHGHALLIGNVCGNARSNSNSRGPCNKFQIAALEAIEDCFVLKKNDFAVGLTAELKTDTSLKTGWHGL